MQFTGDVLDGIASGEVDLAFRSWRTPSVRPGTVLRTAVGMVEIIEVTPVDPSTVTDREARRAGHPGREALLAAQRQGEGRRLHRVVLRFGGADPRAAMREDTALTAEELDGIVAALDRMDARSRRGPWTRVTLGLVHDHPGTRAAELAACAGRDTLPFKADVRRLKEYGLTESLDVGYRLSPRGALVWQHIERIRER
ncbi:hypothetical protein SSP531S_05520 [Streptomyces spongiicola]|uniref:ASCH domain-containing protein n=1 Tax=Streptomyces spongiicola TaxID=1690221 RepID=A0A388SR98_9ACTN|nr:hypothetical protein [Streptomyces spongiicola]GBP99157.1 hypothetical protein SSP531S_05520 [Streptomyces spongiicola]